MPVPSAELRRHHARVRELGCIITRRPEPTLHHIHGGSVNEVIPYELRRGKGQRTNHWLVIPLDISLHSLDGQGIDANMGVRSWELTYGTQVEHLDEVCRRLGLNVWARAGVERFVLALVEGVPKEM